MENIQGQRLQTDEGLQGNEKIESAINEEHINGIILNPWNATLMLDKRLIQIVLGM